MGAKLYELIDRDVRAKLDPSTRMLNGVILVLGIVLGATASWFIWHETQRMLDLGEPWMDEEFALGTEEEAQEELEPEPSHSSNHAK